MRLEEYTVGGVDLRLRVGTRAPVSLAAARPRSGEWIDLGGEQPLVEIIDLAHGRARNNTRFTHSGLGQRLRIVGDPVLSDGEQGQTLTVTQRADDVGLTVRTMLSGSEGIGAVEVRSELENRGDRELLITAASSAAFGFGSGPGGDPGQVRSIEGYSEQLGENRWLRRPVRRSSGVVDFHSSENEGQPGRGAIRAVGRSTWSTSSKLPVGGLVDESTGACVMWQVESNTGWHWEIADDTDGSTMLSVVLLGPTDLENCALITLSPGEVSRTKDAGIAFGSSGFDDAMRELTAHRRWLRRSTLPHWDRESLIYNDYMNTLNGDPSTERLLPLIDAAASIGAEIFCIDCGWYDDTFTDWWATVGEWRPSTARFPGGIDEVLARIRERGMAAGLWLEPEAVGVRSATAKTLPEDHFMRRGGVRICEHERYFLDFRNPAVRSRMSEVFDGLIEDHGVRYFKLDYNTTPGVGYEADGLSLGQALRESGEGYLAFVDGLRRRHPDVTFECCSSGAMRADPETLRHFDLQSTSDQQDFKAYPTIAVGAPMSMVPEQAGNWAYIQPWMTDEQMLFTLVTGASGRMYLSGFVDRFDDRQLEVARRAVDAYKGTRAGLADSWPRWPLGFPEWDDATVVFSRVCSECEYVYIWRRADDGDATIEIPLAMARREVSTVIGGEGWHFELDGSTLTVRSPSAETPTAVEVRIC
jgi:alpha-galactosidase